MTSFWERAYCTFVGATVGAVWVGIMGYWLLMAVGWLLCALFALWRYTR